MMDIYTYIYHLSTSLYIKQLFVKNAKNKRFLLYHLKNTFIRSLFLLSGSLLVSFSLYSQ